MDKIAIIGSPGAGKSTFARKLGEILNIEVIHLDLHFWKSGWNEIPRNERVKLQSKLIQKSRWIIEGTYVSSSDDRLTAADTIIFLDFPNWLCMWQILKRRILDDQKTRPDLPFGCAEKLRLPYLAKVLVFPIRGRRLFHQKIERLQRQKKVRYHRLTSRREVAEFLASIDTETQKQLAKVEEKQLVPI